MISELSIRDALRRLIKQSELNIVAKVIAVDEAKLVCSVEAAGIVIPDVRLKAIHSTDKNACILIPSVNSYVIVEKVENSDEFFIVCYSDIDQAWLNGDTYSITVADKVAERIARLEQAVTALQAKYNTHIHPGPAGVTGVPTISSTEDLAPQTDAEYISSEKVKHG